jgi:hypothetical protein
LYGVDAILGCGNGIFLPEEMIQILHDQGMFTLNQIVDQDSTDMWHQGWLSVGTLGLQGHFSNLWNSYLEELKKGHICIKEEVDCLGWSMNKVGGTIQLDWVILLCVLRKGKTQSGGGIKFGR